MQNSSTGINNTSVGFQTGFDWSITNSNSQSDSLMTFIGYRAGRDASVAQATTLTNSIAIGANAKNTKSNQAVLGDANVTETVLRGLVVGGSGADNWGIGRSTLSNNVTGTQNVAFGAQAMQTNTVGSYNTAIGVNALRTSDSSDNNVAIGNGTMRLTTRGGWNVAIGQDAMLSNTTGSYNTGLGTDALIGNSTGNNNVAVGVGALYSNGTASGNVAVGDSALWNNTNSEGNTAVGRNSMQINSTGVKNTALGWQSGFDWSIINYQSQADSLMTFLGYKAGRDSSLARATGITNSTALGANAKVTKSNQMVLGDSYVTETVVRGIVSASTSFRDTAAFSTTATRLAIYYPGTTGIDNYQVSIRGDSDALPVAGDLLRAWAKTDSLVVTRAAGTTSGLKINILHTK